MLSLRQARPCLDIEPLSSPAEVPHETMSTASIPRPSLPDLPTEPSVDRSLVVAAGHLPTLGSLSPSSMAWSRLRGETPNPSRLLAPHISLNARRMSGTPFPPITGIMRTGRLRQARRAQLVLAGPAPIEINQHARSATTRVGPHLGRNTRQNPRAEVRRRKKILPGQQRFLAIDAGSQETLNRAFNPIVSSSSSPSVLKPARRLQSLPEVPV